jgi:signal transduction histidine kinase
MPEITRILAVDDEPRGVELVARTLRRVGQVETATSAEAGWERAQAERFDLVISDQRMPGMSGVDLLGKIADAQPDTGRILLTGYADLAATVDAINRGRVHAYLSKPCGSEELQVTARGVLERVQLGRENLRLLQELTAKNLELSAAFASLQQAQERIVSSERLAALGRLIAMIVHDLRGPLSVIKSAGSEFKRKGAELADGEVTALAHDVLEESDRMQRRCAELLDATRGSEGRGVLREESLDEVLSAALAQVSTDAARVGVVLEVDLAAGVRLPLDEDRFRRCLLNLVFNAIEAMGEGGVLRVESRREGDAACVSVVDTGPGIPDEIRERLFEPFVTLGKRGGTGLGLAVVKKVIEDHGGSIVVAKAEGGGAAFRLRLPISPPATA